jgi:type II secretory pathway component HofQ
MNRITKIGWLSAVSGVLGLGGALAQDGAAPSVPADPAPPAAVVEPSPAPTVTPAAAAVPAAEPKPAPATEGALELAAEENKDLAGVEVTEAGADNKISITLDNVPLQDVVRMFTRISGANIVSGTNLQGNVTVNLQDVEWEPALKVILDTTGNTLIEKSPGIFTIINKSELAASR